MAELERLEARLGDLAGAVAWPPEPDLRDRVRAGIAAGARRRRVRLVLLAAALALALVGGGAVAATPALRGAVVQWVPAVPSPSPSPTSGSGGVGADLRLGHRYASVADAERAAGFRALVPAALGQPDEVWYGDSTGVIALLYGPRGDLPPSSDRRIGALVMEAAASDSAPAFVKVAGPSTTISQVTVAGGPGEWITGAPHGVSFPVGPDGRTDSFRLAGNVLIWNQAGLVLRIESGLDERGALRVAATAG